MADICTPEEMIRRLRGLHEEMKEPLKEVMDQAAARVHTTAMKNVTPGSSPYKFAPFDTGILRAHLSYEVADQGSHYMGRIGIQKDSDADNYALWVHDGTRPHYAPPAAIQAWAERKSRGGTEVPWFPIWLKIAREGTEAKPFLTDAVASEQNEVFRILSDGIAKYLRDYCGRC